MAKRRLTVAVIAGWSLLLSASPVSAESGRVAALSELRVNDEVEGDVVALGGDVVLGPEARVHGHVVAVFGQVLRDPAAHVEGRSIAISSLSGVSLDPASAGSEPYLDLSVRLLTIGGWLLATSIVAFLFPGRIRFGMWLAPTLGLKMLVLGAMVCLTLFAALVAVIGIGPTLGVPIFVALAVAFLAIRVTGLAVLGGKLGGWLLGRWLHRPIPVTVDVFLGVLLLVGLRFLPVVGGPMWIGLTVASVGTAVFTVALAPQRGTIRAAGAPRQ